MFNKHFNQLDPDIAVVISPDHPILISAPDALVAKKGQIIAYYSLHAGEKGRLKNLLARLALSRLALPTHTQHLLVYSGDRYVSDSTLILDSSNNFDQLFDSFDNVIPESDILSSLKLLNNDAKKSIVERAMVGREMHYVKYNILFNLSLKQNKEKDYSEPVLNINLDYSESVSNIKADYLELPSNIKKDDSERNLSIKKYDSELIFNKKEDDPELIFNVKEDDSERILNIKKEKYKNVYYSDWRDSITLRGAGKETFKSKTFMRNDEVIFTITNFNKSRRKFELLRNLCLSALQIDTRYSDGVLHTDDQKGILILSDKLPTYKHDILKGLRCAAFSGLSLSKVKDDESLDEYSKYLNHSIERGMYEFNKKKNRDIKRNNNR